MFLKLPLVCSLAESVALNWCIWETDIIHGKIKWKQNTTSRARLHYKKVKKYVTWMLKRSFKAKTKKTDNAGICFIMRHSLMENQDQVSAYMQHFWGYLSQVCGKYCLALKGHRTNRLRTNVREWISSSYLISPHDGTRWPTQNKQDKLSKTDNCI